MAEKVTKVNPIVLHDEDRDYTLEFNRESIKFAEAKGFKIGEISNFPLTIYDLFFYAFRMHHSNVAKANTDKIIDDWGGVTHLPDGVLERLIELYAQGFETLVDSKNSKVRVEL